MSDLETLLRMKKRIELERDSLSRAHRLCKNLIGDLESQPVENVRANETAHGPGELTEIASLLTSSKEFIERIFADFETLQNALPQVD